MTSAATPSSPPSLAVLGTGSMAGAVLAGLAVSGTSVGKVVATTRTAASARSLTGLDGLDAEILSLEDDPEANCSAVARADVVIVAVKPALVPALLQEVRGHVRPGALVVSVAAGVPVSVFEAALPESVAVIRSMPNTPALVRRGVTGLAAGTRSTAEQMGIARGLFETVGEVVEVPESQLDALSTISGSGPAYVFLIVEELTAAAVRKGFSPEDAATLVGGTVLGAAELLAATGEDPAELRRRVTSPKGTTERAIAVLRDADLGGLFDRATDAALARAREIAAGS